MVNPDLLAILRCPLDPRRTRLRLEEPHLVCERCALKFPIKDGFPVLVVEEAQLPPGCEALADLPCQREGKPPEASASPPPSESLAHRLRRV
jgi:uncharacterized protein YbaR (Trm112 family)